MAEPRHDGRPEGWSARSDRGPRLDQPVTDRGRLRRPSVDPETFGRFSERIARFMGTAKFLMYMTGFVALWVIWNLASDGLAFDEYPFIFLTLMLSLQASYAAPLILLAQNRQADRDRVSFEQDRSRDERNLADTEYLTREVAALRIAMREAVTRDYLRSELRDLLTELEQRGAVGPPVPPKKGKSKQAKQRSGGSGASRPDKPAPPVEPEQKAPRTSD
ncbi:MAG: DUF1003 domain-containing protein [Austwickia sp.]|jgi:uncharacterized membrane protein|nr:DUF1003 domain-containing protein [Austwickia sp.]MBK8435983.1 DUF1003 domain-containing protein [Austwickia sp.]MBK9101662.1 DUF1003 domain-containing protein [Austwickia sp.]